jgi:hypothetical protein
MGVQDTAQVDVEVVESRREDPDHPGLRVFSLCVVILDVM